MSKSLEERAKEVADLKEVLHLWHQGMVPSPLTKIIDSFEKHAQLIVDQASALTKAQGKLKAVEDSIEGYTFEYGARYKDGTYHEGELNLANEIRKAIE